MPSETSRLRLIYHTLADVFRVQDYADNWQALDAVPGVFICTSATRPSWTSFDDGRLIFETDTRLLWVYDHADSQSFKRVSSSGQLGSAAATSVNVASDTYVNVVSSIVDVGGDRPVQISIQGDVSLVSAPGQLRIYDGAAALLEWTVSPKRRAFTVALGSATAGTYDLSIGLNTATIQWNDGQPQIQAALDAFPGFFGTVYDSAGDFIVSYAGHQPLIADDTLLTGTATSTAIGLALPTEVVAVAIIDDPAAGSVTYSFQARRAETVGSVDFDTIQIDVVEL